MRTIESMKKEKNKNSEIIEKLKVRNKELDKEMEELNMHQIFSEAVKNGIKDVDGLRKALKELDKEKERVLAGGGV